MRVLFVTSEVAGFFKRGGLGDVSRDLPVALSKLGIEVSIILPYYAEIGVGKVSCVGQLAVDFDGKRELVFIFKTKIPGTEVSLYLPRHPLFDKYQDAEIEKRFIFFSKVAAQFYLHSQSIIDDVFDIVHCHDWHTGLVPVILGENKKVESIVTRQKPKTKNIQTLEALGLKTILTIHNLLYTGEASLEQVRLSGLPDELFHIYKTPKGRVVRLMHEGLEYADIISTVSPTYAKEITTTNLGGVLSHVFKRRKDVVVGILNGIDTTIWNPDTDAKIYKKYNNKSVISGKSINKKALQKELGLPQASKPLLGFIGRLEAAQKGTGILRDAVGLLNPNDYQLVILGTGSDKETKLMDNLSNRFDNVRFIGRFDDQLARRIYAGTDMIVIPSRFEPCGLIQMIAMAYGTVPLVRNTGGLSDSVEDNSTGFIFDSYSGRALFKRINEALDLYNNPDEWRKIVNRVMKEDFSWEKSAKEYKKLYSKIDS